jgi:hypothetical protein
MRFQVLIFLTISIFAFILTGCPASTPPTNNNANSTPAANANSGGTNSNVFSSTPKPAEATTNEAPTLKPTFKAYCDAKTKNDEAGLRKVYSAATVKLFEAEMKADNIKTLVEYLEVDQVSNKMCEISNEKIDGETGTALIKTEGMPNGVRVKFVKENGEWKLTNESDDVKSVTDSSKNSNTAK